MKSKKNIPYGIIVPLLILPNILSTVLMSGVGRSTLVSIIYFCIYAYCFQYKRMRRISFSFPMMIWLTLTVFHLMNAYFKHVPDFRVSDYIQAFRIYVAICIFAFLYSINGKKTAQYYYWSLGIWLLLAFIHVGYTPGYRLSGDVSAGVIAVEFGEKAGVMAITGIYLSVMKHSKFPQIVLRMIYPLIIIVLAQARAAFGTAIVQLAGCYYAIVMKAKMSTKQIIMMVIGIVLLILSVNSIMDQTGLGERFHNDFNMAKTAEWGKDYSTGTVFDYIVGERIIYYVTGWEIFMRYPLTGIGLNCYKYYMQGVFHMHVEYMVHLSEGGIVAFVLWTVFITSLFVIILRSSLMRRMKFLALFTMFAILCYSTFSTMYDKETMVSLFGLILSINYPSSKGVFYCYSKQLKQTSRPKS